MILGERREKAEILDFIGEVGIFMRIGRRGIGKAMEGIFVLLGHCELSIMKSEVARVVIEVVRLRILSECKESL